MLIMWHSIVLNTADNGKCKVEDARTTNFNAYASVRGNYAQHFGRNAAFKVSSGQHEYINCGIDSVGRGQF